MYWTIGRANKNTTTPTPHQIAPFLKRGALFSSALAVAMAQIKKPILKIQMKVV